MKKIQILTPAEIKQKTKRIAYQIVEDNHTAKDMVLIGIEPHGTSYAQALKKEIENIQAIKVTVLGISIDKADPLKKDISLSDNSVSLDNRLVVLVDDVANTGKTMYYALQPLLKYRPRKVQAVVLVDRQHKLFPVTPDYVGLSLSTTLQEHIEVEFDKEGNGRAYLI